MIWQEVFILSWQPAARSDRKEDMRRIWRRRRLDARKIVNSLSYHFFVWILCCLLQSTYHWHAVQIKHVISAEIQRWMINCSKTSAIPLSTVQKWRVPGHGVSYFSEYEYVKHSCQCFLYSKTSFCQLLLQQTSYATDFHYALSHLCNDFIMHMMQIICFKWWHHCVNGINWHDNQLNRHSKIMEPPTHLPPVDC